MGLLGGGISTFSLRTQLAGLLLLTNYNGGYGSLISTPINGWTARGENGPSTIRKVRGAAYDSRVRTTPPGDLRGKTDVTFCGQHFRLRADEHDEILA